MNTLAWLSAGLAGLGVAALAAMQTQTPVPDDTASSRLVRIGDMSVARAAHQATPLASGEILITGGCSGACDTNLRSAELYDPGLRVFRPTAAMATARDSHVAVPLADGRVLVAGGWSRQRATGSAEVYEPASGRFAGTGAMAVARATPSAALLADGRVLLSGGQTSELEPLASSEIFDPGSSGFSPAASMTVPRISHVAVTLADGRVLVVGGRQARRGGILRSAEIFDPATGRFQPTGDMSSPRHKHAATLLPDGRVLVIGGSDVRDQRGRYRSTEIYDPRTGTFADGPDMQWPRFKIPDAVATLASGALLVAGGAIQPELYDPASNAFVAIPGELPDAMEFATATPLPNGEVLLLGGYDGEIRTSPSAWLVRAPR